MRRLLCIIGLCCWVLSAHSASALDVVAPSDDGLVIGDTAKLIVKCRDFPRVTVTIGNHSPNVAWTKEAYTYRWIGEVPLPYKGVHKVTIKGKCGWRPAFGEVVIDNSIASSVEIADLVIARFFELKSAESLDWNWGPAIFLYPLLKIAPKSAHRAEYLEYIRAYYRRHLDSGIPSIEWADRCTPALFAFHLASDYGDDFAWSSVEKVMAWIETAERNKLGSLNHLGNDTLQSWFFPDSIWVDSLMMWDVLTVQYALYTGDDALLEFGVEQPFIFEDVLRSPSTGLFYHAWNVEKDQRYPANNAHWLRGNGWVLVSIAEILTAIGEQHERYGDLADIFVDLAEASLEYRQPSGYWDTVMDHPGYAYEESSGSALIAAGYAMGVRLGLLDSEYLGYAVDTFQGITSRIKKRGDGYTMEEISIGTNPSSKLGYKVIPKDRNISYGVGAFVLLADELSEVDF